MSWPASLLNGVLTAAVGLLLAGFVANLSVDWHRVSSFEGGSGYFVVGLAMLGLIGGLIIGIVASRVVAAGATPGFLKALGLAQGVTVGLIVLVGAVSRFTADVAPRLDDEELLLAVEFQWPEGRSPADAADTAVWLVTLGATSGQAIRASREGPLWREDARVDNGQWVVPGAVKVFTSRGGRTLDVRPEGVIDHGYIIPLPKRPGREFLEWSEWLPRARPGGPPPPAGFRYRFRVVPTSQAIRTEAFGAFEISTIASSFRLAMYSSRPPAMIANAQFRILHQGRPVVVGHPAPGQSAPVNFERFDAVSALPGARPALLVQVDAPRGAGPCYLIAEDGDRLRIVHVTLCGGGIAPDPLTSDAELFARSREHSAPDGSFDRVSFATEGFYLLGDVVLDTRTLGLRRYQKHDGRVIERIPPLDVAPDGGSFVRLGYTDDDSGIGLVVFELAAESTYVVRVDQARTRYADIDAVDPAWVRHYFAWERAGGDRFHLVERLGVAPLPYRGRLTTDNSGYREYTLSPARGGLRAAVIDFLVAEFDAKPLPVKIDFSHEVSIDSAVVSVSYRAEDERVGIWMHRGGDTELVATIAERLDAALRTGRFDHHFGR